jgi:cell division protein FtsB
MNNLKIKIDLSKGKFGVKKIYKKGDVVVCVYGGISTERFMSVVFNCEEEVASLNKGNVNESYSVYWLRLATPSEKKLLGTRKFAEIEDISQVKKVIKEKEFPKDWCIEVTEENKKELANFIGHSLNIGNFVYFDKKWSFTYNVEHSFPLITTSQFRKHVLNSTPKEAENKPSEPTEVETLKAEIETLKKELQNQLDNVGMYKGLSDTIEKENLQLEKELDSAKGRNMKLGTEINQLETKAKDYLETIDKLCVERATKEYTIESLHKKIETITKFSVEQIKLILKNE